VVIHVELVRKNGKVRRNMATRKNIDDYPVILTANDISELMQIGKSKAYDMMERKDFPLIRDGRSKRVRKQAFLDWIEQKEQEGRKPVVK
jgi:excisionase family DNA binding protein